MEQKTWSVHTVMENNENSAHNVKETSQKTTKKRSQADKVGKLKYLLQKDHKLDQRLDKIELMLRTLLTGLKPSFNFDQPLIEKLTCRDNVDKEILQLLFEAGALGVLPKDLAAKLAVFKLTRHQVSRRIIRINKRLTKELGSPVAEQRGWHWALTGFASDAFRVSCREDLTANTHLAGAEGDN
jgi:hypothetical protein